MGKAVYNRIKDIFDNVNEWLKFAEAKHAGLIVLNSGIVFGTLTVYRDFSHLLNKWEILASFFFIGLSLLNSFASLFPRTNRKINNKKKPKKANLFFAGDLSQFDEQDLKKELLKQMGSDHKFDGLEEDLLHQIIVNSSIATKKYQLFKHAIIALIIGLLIPAVFSIYRILWHY